MCFAVKASKVKKITTDVEASKPDTSVSKTEERVDSPQVQQPQGFKFVDPSILRQLKKANNPEPKHEPEPEPPRKTETKQEPKEESDEYESGSEYETDSEYESGSEYETDTDEEEK